MTLDEIIRDALNYEAEQTKMSSEQSDLLLRRILDEYDKSNQVGV